MSATIHTARACASRDAEQIDAVDESRIPGYQP
jgi:hypothetical protein